MLVQIKSAKGIDTIPIETKLLYDRDIYIVGAITDESVMDIEKQLLYLLRENEKEPVRIWINSQGGAIVSGLVLYDILTSIETPIITIGCGPVYSMGAFLLATASRKRYVFPNTELMLHEPLISGGAGGSCSYIKGISDSLFDSKKKINEILAKHTGKTIEEIDKVTLRDTYFSANEALRFGLVDRIITMNEILREVKHYD